MNADTNTLSLVPVSDNNTLCDIALSHIHASPQIRTEFDPAELQLLADDIAANGVLQPILVRPIGEDHFCIIAGERRVRAARLAGLATVPALVATIPEEDVLELQLAENIQREELSLNELAQAIEALYAKHKTVAAVAALVHKSASWVSKHLTLTTKDFGEPAKRLMLEGVTEDIELLMLVNQAYKINWIEGQELANQIRRKDVNRDKAREFVARLKQSEKDKADAATRKAEKQAKKAPAAPRAQQLNIAAAWAEITAELEVQPATQRPTTGEIVQRYTSDEQTALLAGLHEQHALGRAARELDARTQHRRIVLECSPYRIHQSAAFLAGLHGSTVDSSDIVTLTLADVINELRELQ